MPSLRIRGYFRPANSSVSRPTVKKFLSPNELPLSSPQCLTPLPQRSRINAVRCHDDLEKRTPENGQRVANSASWRHHDKMNVLAD